MWLFLIIVIAHWLEHLVQLGQVTAGVHRACASGFLGYFFPVLVQSEVLHWGYASVMLVGLIVLTHRFSGAALHWWFAASLLQLWHFIEHTILFYQVQVLGVTTPLSILQLVFPRIELHLFYNTIVTIPMVIALVLRHRRPLRGPSAIFKVYGMSQPAQSWRG